MILEGQYLAESAARAAGELELNLWIKPKWRIKRDYPGELDVPTGSNQVWSMDFMSGQFVSGTSL